MKGGLDNKITVKSNIRNYDVFFENSFSFITDIQNKHDPIFVIDKNYDDNLASVSIPYEFLPLPTKGQKVKALDRAGKYVCDAIVKDVKSIKRFNKTNIVTILIDRKFVNEVRSITM